MVNLSEEVCMARTSKGNERGESSKPRVTGLGQPMDVAVSALAKEIRRSDERAACYWGLLVYQREPHYFWKRVLLAAAEDVGIADPAAVALVGSLYQMWLGVKAVGWYADPEHPVMALVALCRAKKSTEVDDLKNLTLEEIKAKVLRPVLPEYMDGHTAEGKAQGADWMDWYRFRVACGAPVNQYLRELWRLKPEWAPPEQMEPSEPGEPQS
jgi:replication-associated recombination protein RarA